MRKLNGVGLVLLEPFVAGCKSQTPCEEIRSEIVAISEQQEDIELMHEKASHIKKKEEFDMQSE